MTPRLWFRLVWYCLWPGCPVRRRLAWWWLTGQHWRFDALEAASADI